jgi:hypothetical protein
MGMRHAAAGHRDHLTFKGNLRGARYGWLRLTPAYSVHVVRELLDERWSRGAVVLDPFCGTGTTALVCAERGIECDTTDINPFLLWLARTKTARYSAADLETFQRTAAVVSEAIRRTGQRAPWIPPIHQIEKWWPRRTLFALGRAMGAISASERTEPAPAVDLLKVAFCRTMIDHANVSFGHQSMSFRKTGDLGSAKSRPAGVEERIGKTWSQSTHAIADAARSRIITTPSAVLCDARDLRAKLERDRYGCVITSPPYPNRMSYVRELRPYLYWLGYVNDGREAGDLDWRAIGGTWGCATSMVAKWTPDKPVRIPFDGFERIASRISRSSRILGRYVTKYFHDMTGHCESLFDVVAPGGTVHYIVGNSKFYDVMLPVEQIYAAMFQAAGFANATVRTIRKRTSKKELFEFVVSAYRAK